MSRTAAVIVIGGGAAGMVAAIAAARRGAAVTVLERMPRVGKKLLATGNGRCNFANAHLALQPLPRDGPRIRRRGAGCLRPRGDTRLLPGPRHRTARGRGRQDLPALGPGLRRPRRAAPRTGAPRGGDALRGRGHAPGAASRRVGGRHARRDPHGAAPWCSPAAGGHRRSSARTAAATNWCDRSAIA